LTAPFDVPREFADCLSGEPDAVCGFRVQRRFARGHWGLRTLRLGAGTSVRNRLFRLRRTGEMTDGNSVEAGARTIDAYAAPGRPACLPSVRGDRDRSATCS
jgi:hypothetical protein